MPLQFLSRSVCCLLAVLFFLSTVGTGLSVAQEESEFFIGGSLHDKQYDQECEAVGRIFSNELGMMSLFANAFYDAESTSTLCFHVLGNEGAPPPPQDMVFRISDREGQLLDALTPPMTSSTAELTECNIWQVYFEDYNQDGITDILLGIGCFNPEINGGQGQGDSVVYLSSISEGSIWLRQNEDVNTAIASLDDYTQAASVIRSVLGGNTPHPPMTPPPPPPPAPSATPDISTCIYDTGNGPDVITYNNASGVVIGSFGGEGGTIAGIKDGPQTRGVWKRGAEQGDFVLFHEAWGYSGDWKRIGQQDWTGEWSAKIVNCQ